MRKFILLILAFFMLSVNAFAEGMPTVFIENSTDTSAKTVTVNIGISEATQACGGSFNLVYDNSILKPNSYKATENMDNYTALVNLNYSENTIRFSWAGTDEMQTSGVMFQVVFDIISDTSFETDMKIENLKLADIDSNKIEAISESGSIKYEVETQTTTTKRHYSSGGIKTVVTTETNTSETESIVESVKEFSDVKSTEWFYTYVNEAYEKGYMTGVSDTEFAPNDSLTRAMFVTVLYRIEGEPAFMNDLIFDDVEKGSYYEKAVVWASGKGIVLGMSESKFAPNENITREQIATILYRYANHKGIDTESITADTNTLFFNDIFEVSDWAASGMHFCIAADIILGDGENVKPKDNATRAEMATMISRFTKVIK